MSSNLFVLPWEVYTLMMQLHSAVPDLMGLGRPVNSGCPHSCLYQASIVSAIPCAEGTAVQLFTELVPCESYAQDTRCTGLVPLPLLNIFPRARPPWHN